MVSNTLSGDVAHSANVTFREARKDWVQETRVRNLLRDDRCDIDVLLASIQSTARVNACHEAASMLACVRKQQLLIEQVRPRQAKKKKADKVIHLNDAPLDFEEANDEDSDDDEPDDQEFDFEEVEDKVSYTSCNSLINQSISQSINQ
jgi:hypothetical protein